MLVFTIKYIYIYIINVKFMLCLVGMCEWKNQGKSGKKTKFPFIWFMVGNGNMRRNWWDSGVFYLGLPNNFFQNLNW